MDYNVRYFDHIPDKPIIIHYDSIGKYLIKSYYYQNENDYKNHKYDVKCSIFYNTNDEAERNLQSFWNHFRYDTKTIIDSNILDQQRSYQQYQYKYNNYAKTNQKYTMFIFIIFIGILLIIRNLFINSNYQLHYIHEVFGGSWSACTHINNKLTLNFDYGLAYYISNELKPSSVLEYGSGLGLYLDFFMNKCNLSIAIGIEPEIINIPYLNTYKSINNININSNISSYPMQSTFNIIYYKPNYNYNNSIHKHLFSTKYDVVYSIEVAEHINDQYHEKLVQFLVLCTNNWIIFSAGRPIQKGIGHISLKSKYYWIKLFEKYNMIYTLNHTNILHYYIDSNNVNHRINSLVFYKRNNNNNLILAENNIIIINSKFNHTLLAEEKDQVMYDLWGDFLNNILEIHKYCLNKDNILNILYDLIINIYHMFI